MGALRVTLLAVMLVSVPAISALSPSPSDQGFFVDASDDRNEPSELKEPGTYRGLLLPEDEEWFRLPAQKYQDAGMDQACIEASFSGPAKATTTLTADSHAFDINATLAPGYEPDLGLAVHGFLGTTLGLSPTDSPASFGLYGFDLSIHTEDSLTATETVGLDPCQLVNVPAQETISEQIHLEEGQAITLSISDFSNQKVALTHPDVEVQLLIDGEDLAGQLDIVKTGSWTLSMENSGDTNSTYLLGVSLVDDCCRPCYPNCFESTGIR